MHDSELHDLSDDSDYVASQLQGSGAGADGGGGGGGGEVVYSKDNVAIHPTQFSSERIGGRLRLVKQGAGLFMSWIPYRLSPGSGGNLAAHGVNASLLEKDRSLYTIGDVLLAEFHSIRRHTPAIGWQYRSLSSLKLHGVVAVATETPSPRPFSSLPAVQESDTDIGIAQNGSSRMSGYSGRPKKKPGAPAHDISIQVLEKFSLVTKFARDTTTQLFRENQNNGLSNYDKRQQSTVPSAAATIAPTANLEVAAEIPVVSDPLEFEQLSLVWGKPRKHPMGLEEWNSILDCEGRIMDSKALRRRIFYGGVQHGLRKEVWKFLLGHHAYDSTYAEREYLLSVKAEYEAIKSQWQNISPAQARRFTKYRERKGLIDKDVVRTDRSIPFYDGDENDNVGLLRDILLTYSFYNFDLGYCQGMSDFLSPILFVMEDESESFWCFAALMERLGPNFNRDQSGMHSQFFALSKLVELLDLPLHNYLKQADCLNYFFCFRWVLIQFKREFEYDQIMLLWEVLWTHYFSEHFHLYVCVAILKKYRKKIMGEQMDFDTLLKFINELSTHINLDGTLRDAEALCNCAGENGAACIPPGTPPSLPLESAQFYANQDDIDDFGRTGCI